MALFPYSTKMLDHVQKSRWCITNYDVSWRWVARVISARGDPQEAIPRHGWLSLGSLCDVPLPCKSILLAFTWLVSLQKVEEPSKASHHSL